MTTKEYEVEVARTVSNNHDSIRARFSVMGITDLVHAQIGISGESGEFADAVKRFLYYGRPLDALNAKEELGDLLWYIALGAKVLETSIEELMEDNINKLKLRYPEKFTEELAIERKDKQ